MTIAILVFICGVAYEGSAVGFVHFSERRAPFKVALCSMIGATAEVSGVFAAVKDWHIAPAFILGYGVGGYLLTRFKMGRV